jgi:hypothetical protein
MIRNRSLTLLLIPITLTAFSYIAYNMIDFQDYLTSELKDLSQEFYDIADYISKPLPQQLQ